MAGSDSILSKAEILDAVRAQIAAQVVSGLDDETKKAIIAEAVAEIIGGWEFKRILEAEVKKVAAHELINHLARPDVKENLREQAVQAATTFVDTFGPAMLEMLYNAAGVTRGRDGYSRPTDIGEAVRNQLGIDKK